MRKEKKPNVKKSNFVTKKKRTKLKKNYTESNVRTGEKNEGVLHLMSIH